ncbi:MAG: TonB-dependent receptor [Acidobacteriaceae bacterium]|nr:TonB-dependent receptor [Acidobacteriaceae bacterium]
MKFLRIFLLVFLPICPALAQVTPDPNQSSPVNSNLQPAPIRTTVTVNGTISSQTPASISVLDNQQLQTVPGTQLDDRLRQVPGFSLFRRSSSVVANPTTQGVSLRGIGSSGASRTLVLWDSIPLNDPFGGWVYWDRVDPAFVDRVEVERGGTTAVFGDRALSGSVSLFSPAEQPDHLFANFLTGNLGTEDASAAYSNLWGNWGFTAHSRAFTTDGYYIVPDSLRGRVDDKANVRFATGDIHIDYLGRSNRLSVLFNVLAEERQNGTLLTHNSTGLGTVGANYTHSWSNDQVSFLAFHTREQFHSTFSSVSPNRNVETLTSRQTVPVEDIGGAGYWQHHGQTRAIKWNSIVGADVDDVHGISYDYSYTTHILTPGGGTLLSHGIFGQADLSIGPVRFFTGLRHQFTGQRDETFVAPNGGIAVGLHQFRFRASGYSTFRAPTLNELYRNFRVGNVLTLANPALVPEGLVGVETGVDWSRENSRISLSLFRNDLSDLITNSTLRVTPNQITRQRTNLSSGLSRGVEVNALHHWRHWTGEAGYLFADARVSTGQRIPQVPKQQGTAQLTYSVKRTLISAGIRSFGLQFDDDLNQFKLPGYAALQLSAQQQITPKLSVVASVENLLDRTFLVALTPTPNTGEPRIFRVGLRWNGAIK